MPTLTKFTGTEATPLPVHDKPIVPTTEAKPPVKLTDSEKKKIREIVQRAKTFDFVTTTCTSDFWRARQRALREAIAKVTDPTDLDEMIDDLVEATARRKSTQEGSLQDVRNILKHRSAAVLKEAQPILVDAGTRACVTLVEDSAKAQEKQDLDHDARGIPHAPCPAAATLNAQADAIMRSARSMDLDSI